MADLELTASFSQIIQADKAVLGLEKRFGEIAKAAKRSAASHAQLLSVFDRLEKQGLSLSQVQRSIDNDLKNNQKTAAKLESEYQKLSLSQKSARDSASAMAQAFRQQEGEAREAARTAKENATANRNLRMEFKEGYAAQVQLRAAQMRLSQARREGIITDAEYKKQLDRLADSAVTGTRHMNRAGVAMQQTGYQVGDFLVQIQGGTNPMVAFGQQATQLVGVLYMLPAATLAGSVGIMGLRISVGLLIASLGIIIPLATALGAAWMRTRGEAKSFDDELGRLAKTVSDLTEITDVLKMSTSDLGEKYGDASKSIREYAEIEAILRAVLAKGEVEEAVDQLSNMVDAYASVSSSGRMYLNTLDRIKDGFKVGHQEAEILEGVLSRLASANTFEEQSREVEVLLSNLETMQVSLQALPKPVAEMLLNYIRANRTVEEANKLIADLEAGVEQVADAAGGIGQSLQYAIDQANAFATAMGRARTESLGIGISTVGINAQIAALESGASKAEATARAAAATLRETLTSELGGDVGRGTSGNIERQVEARYQSVLERERAQEALTALNKPAEAGGSGGGGTQESNNGVSAFMQQFLTDGEQLDIWREDQLVKLQEFNANELALLQAHGINKASIEEEYKNKVQAIKAMERTETLNNYASLFGALGSLMGSEGRKMLKVQAAISGAATMINAYEAASKAAAKAPDPITAASVWAGFVAKGIATVAKIKSLGSGGSPSGSAGGSISGGASTPSQSMATPQAAPKDQRVLIKGLGPKDLLTGEMLQELFDKLYDENQERGAVFMVST